MHKRLWDTKHGEVNINLFIFNTGWSVYGINPKFVYISIYNANLTSVA